MNFNRLIKGYDKSDFSSMLSIVVVADEPLQDKINMMNKYQRIALKKNLHRLSLDHFNGITKPVSAYKIKG